MISVVLLGILYKRRRCHLPIIIIILFGIQIRVGVGACAMCKHKNKHILTTTIPTCKYGRS